MSKVVHRDRQILHPEAHGFHAPLRDRSHSLASQSPANIRRQSSPFELGRQHSQAGSLGQTGTVSASWIYKGILWKLNVDADPHDSSQWMKRDMWIDSNGALAYFSVKRNKAEVLIDEEKIRGAKIASFSGGCKDNAFEIRLASGTGKVTYLACETAAEALGWFANLQRASAGDTKEASLPDDNEDHTHLQVSVANRRIKVEDGEKARQFTPAFKGILWKVKDGGDLKKKEDWRERDMWVAKNGSLVYYSKKENQELVYYTSEDIAKATIVQVQNGKAFFPWVFRVQLELSNNIEHVPGVFAAESAAMRNAWLKEFEKVKDRYRHFEAMVETIDPQRSSKEKLFAVENDQRALRDDIDDVRDEVSELTRMMHQLLSRLDAEEKY